MTPATGPVWHAWDSTVPKRTYKHKPFTAVTEHRLMAQADAISLADAERIHAEAVAYAAEQMRRFNERTGR